MHAAKVSHRKDGTVFELLLWQWVLLGGVAVTSVGPMVLAMARMFPVDPDRSGTLRPSTPLETGFVGALPQAGEHAFDGWSYRVQGRYAGRVRVVVDADSLRIAGPRIPRGLYVFWIWLQGLSLSLVPVFAVWALVGLMWAPLLLALASLLVSLAAMAVGAGVWPGLGETVLAGDGHFIAIEIPRSRVREVQRGGGWARDGMQTVVLLYKKAIDPLAKHAVTFRAPDGEGHDVIYAIQMFSDADARELEALLTT